MKDSTNQVLNRLLTVYQSDMLRRFGAQQKFGPWLLEVDISRMRMIARHIAVVVS